MDWPARLLDQRAGPKGTGYVVQYLGVELLPAEPGALVLAYDLLQKRRREVGPIVVCRAACDHSTSYWQPSLARKVANLTSQSTPSTRPSTDHRPTGDSSSASSSQS